MQTIFLYIKVWFKGVYFSWTCFPDDKGRTGVLTTDVLGSDVANRY